MALPLPRARSFSLLLACAVAAPLAAQQLIGYVNTHDADLSGVSDVLDGQAVLTGSASVTAKDHTAPITLGRGGTARVCQTSVLHLTESRTPLTPAPLLFSLDRGAIEIQTKSTPNDSIMTPDLRFAVHTAGPLDLRLRIARNGDTCVDNRGPGAPTLYVSDPFGEAQYEVAPGQHVLFEHGSVHEVVDNETSPCGCPDEKGSSIADALLASPKAALGAAPRPATVRPPVAAPVVVASAPAAATPAAPAAPAAATPAATVAIAPVIVDASPSTAAPSVTPPPAQPAAPPVVPEETVEQAAAEAAARAAALHPFPTAISEGLAPTEPAPVPVSGSPATPAVEPLRYNAPVSPAETASAAAPAAPSPAKKAPKAKPIARPKPAQSNPPNNDLVHIFGRFFRRLFTW